MMLTINQVSYWQW